MTDSLRTRGLRYLRRIEDIYAPMLATNPDDLSDTAHTAIAIVGLGLLIAGLDKDSADGPPTIAD